MKKYKQDATRKTSTSSKTATVTISGPGVVHVRSSEIIKTEKAQQQLDALKSLSNRGIVP